jgi:TRAP-type mannitol/chloroaromatic compound transport system permease small subunit
MAENAPAAAEMATAQDSPATVEDIPWALRVSDRLRKFVDTVGRWGSWLALPMILFTVLDVISRKIAWLDDAGRLHGLQIFLTRNVGRMFESTMLQELEWHFHAGLFALVLGYGYIHNSHVRVDLVRENLKFRKQAWLELIGITVFLIPYLLTIIWFAWGYAVTSYEMNEVSASTVGLEHRWVIKSVLVFGLIVAGVAGIAVWLQVALALFGDPNRRFPLMTLDWPEEAGSRIEGKERIKLEGSMDALAAPDEDTRKRTSDILTGG